MGVTVLPPDINESDTDFKVVYTHPDGSEPSRRRPKAPSERFKTRSARRFASASAPCAASAGRRSRRSSSARSDGAVPRSLRLRGARRRQAREQGRVRGAGAVRRVRLDARSRAACRGRGPSRRSTSRSSARAPRAAIARRGRRRSSACSMPRRARGARHAAERGRLRRVRAWDRREMLVRERQSLGFYVSGHPLERYLKGEAGLAKLGASPVSRVRSNGRLGAGEASSGWSRATASASSRTAAARSRSSISRT